MPLFDLPNELLLEIAGNLDRNGLANLLQACRQLTFLIPILEAVLKDAQKTQAFFWAARHGHKDLVKIMLSNGSEIDSFDLPIIKKYKYLTTPPPMTALQYAAQYGHIAIVRMLVRMGASLEIRSKELPPRERRRRRDEEDSRYFGGTALHYAAIGDLKQKRASSSVVKFLLDAGADITALSNGDKTPLHWAVLNISEYAYEVILLLLDHGVSIDARDTHRVTALHGLFLYKAMTRRDTADAAINLLLARGADTGIRRVVHPPDCDESGGQSGSQNCEQS